MCVICVLFHLHFCAYVRYNVVTTKGTQETNNQPHRTTQANEDIGTAS